MQGKTSKNIIKRILSAFILMLFISSTIFFFVKDKNIFNRIPKAHAATSTSLDGTATAIGTTETTIGTLSTSLASGDNIIIVTVEIFRSASTATVIAAGNLKLKRGATVLDSNEFAIRMGDSGQRRTTYTFLLYKDTAAPANPQYDVTALADVAGASGEVKMVILNGIANTSYSNGASTTVGTSEVTVGSSTMSASGDNIIIAAGQFRNSNVASARNLAAGNVQLAKSGVTLESNNYLMDLFAESAGNLSAASVLLVAKDAGAAASSTYALEATSNNATDITGEAKIIVINGQYASALDTGSVSVGTTETSIGTLTTSNPTGDNIVVAGFELDNSANASLTTYAAGDIRLKNSTTTLASNESAIALNSSGSTRQAWRHGGLVYRDASATANKTYDIKALTSVAGGVMASKYVVISTVSNSIPTFEQKVYRWIANADNTTGGSALAANNTPYTTTSTGMQFRLRMLIGVGIAQLGASGQSFKLQFGGKGGGTCQFLAGTPGTYTDITTSTVISYYDNATPTDGANLTANAGADPTDANTIVNQTYEELNNFTNSTAAIPAGQNGKWDFSLYDNGATAGATYCIRAVTSTGTVLDTYTVRPEITIYTPPAGLTIDQITRHGGGILNGTKYPYSF